MQELGKLNEVGALRAIRIVQGVSYLLLVKKEKGMSVQSQTWPSSSWRKEKKRLS